MQKKNYFFFTLCIYTLTDGCAITNAVEEWRRLGDNILTVTKSLYFSEKFRLPFYYTPFPYSSDFLFSENENLLTGHVKSSFSGIAIIRTEDDIKEAIESGEKLLLICAFLSHATEDIFEYVKHPENNRFSAKIEKAFTPIKPISPLPKKKDTLLIGLHVRKGGGYDFPLNSIQQYNLDEPIVKENQLYIYRKNPAISTDDIWPLESLPGPSFTTQTKLLQFKKTYYSDYIWPIKLPPDQYYIEQIKVLAEMVPSHMAFQIILFTDDPNPEDIVARYTKALGNPPQSKVQFFYRKFDNKHNQNVIDDLFYLASCDCIISAHSSFAMSAHLIGHHSVIIYPEHAITLPDRVIINGIKTIVIEHPTNPLKRSVHVQSKQLPSLI